MTSVTVEREGAVASVVLPGPALSLAVKEGLLESLRAVAADDQVRAVVLTGTGKAFCVGQDLAEHAAALEKDPATSLDTVTEHYNPIVTALATMPKPVVARVNGTCVGAGLGFVLACDFVVMAEGAVLGTAFTGIGLTCDSGLSVSLPEAVGTVYTKMKGWKTATEGVRSFEELPKLAQEYLRFLERESGAKIGMVSTGPDREQTMEMPEFRAALRAMQS